MTGQKSGQDSDGNLSGIPCPASSTSAAQKQGIRGFIGFLISCCPYTMIGRKIMQCLRDETGAPHNQLTNREIQLKSNIKIGYGIMLVGIFCPIFWISFLSGARGNELMFNTVHSGIVILLGFLYFAIYRIHLRKEQEQGKRKERTSQENP